MTKGSTKKKTTKRASAANPGRYTKSEIAARKAAKVSKITPRYPPSLSLYRGPRPNLKHLILGT